MKTRTWTSSATPAPALAPLLRWGAALMLVGGLLAAVSFFVPWVSARPPSAGIVVGVASSPWQVMTQGGASLLLVVLLLAELLLGLEGLLPLLGRSWVLPLGACMALALLGVLAVILVAAIITLRASFDSAYDISTSVGPWLAVAGFFLVLIGGVVAHAPPDLLE